MNWRFWIRPKPGEDIAFTPEQWFDICAKRQLESYHYGLEVGRAQGELAGLRRALEAIVQALKERNPFGELTEADVERAKRGMVH